MEDSAPECRHFIELPVQFRFTQPTGRWYNRKQGAILVGVPQKGVVGNDSKASANPPYFYLPIQE